MPGTGCCAENAATAGYLGGTLHVGITARFLGGWWEAPDFATRPACPPPPPPPWKCPPTPPTHTPNHHTHPHTHTPTHPHTHTPFFWKCPTRARARARTHARTPPPRQKGRCCLPPWNKNNQGAMHIQNNRGKKGTPPPPPPPPFGLCPAQWQAALNQREHSARALHSECDPVRSCALNSIRWRVHHKPCVHASSDLSGYGPIPPQVLTRFVYSALDDAASMRASKNKFSDVKPESGRESASCALLCEVFRPSSGSQTRVFVEVAEARSRARRARDGWGRDQAQDTTADADGIREISDKARSESRDVETTSSCSSRCAGFATQEVQSEVGKTAAVIKSSSSLFDARHNQQRSRRLCSSSTTEQPGTQPGSGTQPATRRWRSLPVRSRLLPPNLSVVMVGGGGGGGGPTNTFAMQEMKNNPGLNPEAGQTPRLLMVGVPRTHSARCQFNLRSPSWSPTISRPGVQAAAVCIRGGCQSNLYLCAHSM